jgi:hypothetical protein
MKAENCNIEGCDGKSSGNLIIIDKETQREINVCSTCYFNLRGENGKTE